MATLVLLMLNITVVHGQEARGTVRVTWPRALHAFQRGDTVRTGDYVLADTVIAWHWSNTQPDTTRAITGWVARRTIAEGEFLRSPSVAPAPVITIGSTVQVLWQDGSLRLTLTGTATNNAALGAPVGVRIDRNRRLDGVAVGSNTVRLR
jgi:flagella basal body P-ring formation protein FlgA